MRRLTIIAALVLSALVSPSATLAFAPQSNEVQRAPGQGVPGGLDGRGFGLPDDMPTGPAVEDDEGFDPSTGPTGAADRPATPPPVFRGETDLPETVRRTRNSIIEAAHSGDPEALRPIVEAADPPPVFASFPDMDPIDILRTLSGDEAGREILAIMLDVLDAGWVRLDVGTPRERYVWPYFAALDPESLDARQQVDLFRLLTAGDFDEMRAAGTYIFYRLEIAPDGRWIAFVAGE